MSLPRADGPLGAAPRAPAADPADDGITTVTVTLLEDSRGGATHALSRKREPHSRLGDDDDASRGDPPRAFADSFPRDCFVVDARSDDVSALSLSQGSDLLPNDDAWNAVLTAFEAHCLRGGDGAEGPGDETPRADARARFQSEETPSFELRGAFEFAGGDAERVQRSFSCADVPHVLPSPPFVFVDHTSRDDVSRDVAHDPHRSNRGENAVLEHMLPRTRASAADTGEDEVFDFETRLSQKNEVFHPTRAVASDLPSSPTSVTAAERVRAHAARALRSLIFGRDDGRGRRRSALEGPRVSRRGAKPKSVRSRSLARAPTRRASPRDVPLHSGLNTHTEDVSGTPDVSGTLDPDFDDLLNPEDDPEDESLGAHYALRDPARWRAAATTASSVAAVEAAAALAAAAGSRSRSGCDPDANDASVQKKLAALREDFVVELERLAVVERALVAGERGALARWPSPDGKSEPNQSSEAFPLGAPPAENTEGSGGDCLGDGFLETSGAARAMRRSAAARFRECRFRVLETFERDAAGVARFLEKKTEAATTRARPDAAGAAAAAGRKRRKQTNDAYGAGTQSGATSAHETLSHAIRETARPARPATFKGGGKSRHSARARGVLEAWLAEHFYPTPFRSKPVPTREEKKRLALETGLTERQVGDWFVNARARVWKPEMKALLGEIHTER